MVNKYLEKASNISDLLGGINIDLDKVNSMVKLIRCNLGGANEINISDNEGSIIAFKDDVINYFEILQTLLQDIIKNIKDLQSADELKLIKYKVGGK